VLLQTREEEFVFIVVEMALEDLGVAAVRIKKPTIGITVIGGDGDAAA
jgi:hypothetical protein